MVPVLEHEALDDESWQHDCFIYIEKYHYAIHKYQNTHMCTTITFGAEEMCLPNYDGIIVTTGMKEI
jgi:hypothetical protein